MTFDNVNPEAVVTSTRRSALVLAGIEALRRGLRLTALALWEALLLLWLCLCVCLLVVGVGLWLVPPALDAVRTQARRQRRLAWQLSGLRVTENYLPDPATAGGLLAGWRREYARAGDPSTWKDLLWHVVDPFVGAALAFAPAALLLNGVFGLLPLLWAPVVSHWENSWYYFIPITTVGGTILASLLGAATMVLAMLVGPSLVRLHSRWVEAVLSTQSREELQARVEHLSSSRSHAVDHEASEVRRIERDLHDGA
ncbi:MAG: sensor domain-containing protein [Humibacillus sp.]|nr:sensor domain-containing protein [Humibacillus sp.]MDN5776893.1 sensor domain-containing protein [Humibacillus sp.]